MESTGVRDKIQISKVTSDLLIKAGKSHWIQPREDVIDAKGKGMMQTYWLNIDSKKTISNSGTSDGVGGGNNSDYFTTDEAITSKSTLMSINEVGSKQDC